MLLHRPIVAQFIWGYTQVKLILKQGGTCGRARPIGISYALFRYLADGSAPRVIKAGISVWDSYRMGTYLLKPG